MEGLSLQAHSQKFCDFTVSDRMPETASTKEYK